MRKEGFLILGIFIIIIFGNVLVSAICCEKLKNSDMWCQTATNINQCAGKPYFAWTDVQTCDSRPECSGVCVNANSGKCSENTPQTQCKESGGTWSEKLISEIPACQEACCLLGQDAYFINPTECKALFTEHNAQGIIRTDITSREDCAAMVSRIKVGACVVSTSTEKECSIKTDIECTKDKISVLSGILKTAYSQNEVEIKFYDGLLCTASINNVGISDCAKSEDTECKDNKAYFMDTCGNDANVYDSNKYGNVDYWTRIIDPYTSNEVCPVGISGSSICGNCDPTTNTVCQNYNDANKPKPSKNLGGFVCGDLSCKYNGKTYQHGESWCEGTAGTFAINVNLQTSEIVPSNLTALKNESKYNIPGSSYYKLVCSFGKVLVEECGDYRSSVCIEGKNEAGSSEASCVFNNWKTCFQMETKTECEDPTALCKWIPGYRWDSTIVPEDKRKEQQGSCVPLAAPGFDFWNENSQANAICGMGGVQESALFETSWRVSRDKFADWSDKRHAQQCINGCYAIPGYAHEFNQLPNEAKIYPEDIKKTNNQILNVFTPTTNYQKLTLFYDNSGYNLDAYVRDYALSIRRGQYCHKDGKPDQWLTGKVTGPDYDCTAVAGSYDKTQRKTRDYPIYLTNQEWFNSITERARSLGDCGYKIDINGKYSDPETEIITAIFQTLSQKGTVKRNITAEQILYKGGKPVVGTLYTTELPITPATYSCASDYSGICTNTVNNPNTCDGGEANTVATCPANMVCCVYPDLS